MSSPEIIRDKAKEDLDFRQRLLDYIENVASECFPQNPDSDWMDIDDVADADVDDDLQTDDESKDQIFQPFPDPDDPDFDLLFNRSIFHIA